MSFILEITEDPEINQGMKRFGQEPGTVSFYVSWIEGGLCDPIYLEYSINRRYDIAVNRENIF